MWQPVDGQEPPQSFLTCPTCNCPFAVAAQGGVDFLPPREVLGRAG